MNILFELHAATRLLFLNDHLMNPRERSSAANLLIKVDLVSHIQTVPSSEHKATTSEYFEDQSKSLILDTLVGFVAIRGLSGLFWSNIDIAPPRNAAMCEKNGVLSILIFLTC